MSRDVWRYFTCVEFVTCVEVLHVCDSTNLKLLRNLVPGLKIVVSNFHKDFFDNSKYIEFFAKTFLHTLLRISQEPLNIYKKMIISHERTFEDLSESP